MLTGLQSLSLGGHALSLGWARVGALGADSLTDGERALLSPRATPPRRAQFVAGRAAARKALARLGVAVEGRSILRRRPPDPEAGRPLLVDAQGRSLEGAASLALTHSGALACAVAMVGAQRIGVDLELVAPPDTAAFMDEAFAPGELEGFARFEAFGLHPRTLAWTVKEAALKVWGVGLRAVLPAVRLLPQAPRPDAPGRVTFACRLQVGTQPAGLPPPPLRLACASAFHGAAVLSVALEQAP